MAMLSGGWVSGVSANSHISLYVRRSSVHSDATYARAVMHATAHEDGTLFCVLTRADELPEGFMPDFGFVSSYDATHSTPAEDAVASRYERHGAPENWEYQFDLVLLHRTEYSAWCAIETEGGERTSAQEISERGVHFSYERLPIEDVDADASSGSDDVISFSKPVFITVVVLGAIMSAFFCILTGIKLVQLLKQIENAGSSNSPSGKNSEGGGDVIIITPASSPNPLTPSKFGRRLRLNLPPSPDRRTATIAMLPDGSPDSSSTTFEEVYGPTL